jgi:hypothetical protein
VDVKILRVIQKNFNPSDASPKDAGQYRCKFFDTVKKSGCKSLQHRLQRFNRGSAPGAADPGVPVPPRPPQHATSYPHLQNIRKDIARVADETMKQLPASTTKTPMYQTNAGGRRAYSQQSSPFRTPGSSAWPSPVSRFESPTPGRNTGVHPCSGH